MDYKLCFILSSVGGPKMLTPLFARDVRDDVAYIVLQQMPNLEFTEVLVKCLKEDIPRNIICVNEDMEISPGSIYFLSNQNQYLIDGTHIRISGAAGSPDKGKSIDILLESASRSNHSSTVLILSGVLLDKDGIKGIQSLKQQGARIFASSKKNTPVTNMIEELEKLKLIDECYPPTSLLANLDFSFSKPADPSQPYLLVVDDEADVREVIGDILSLEKIACDFAGDGLEALQKIQKTKYSGLILDIKMPEIDGLQTLDALHTIEPEIPIIIITGYDDDQTRTASQNPNVIGLLLKPFTGEDLKKHLIKLKKD